MSHITVERKRRRQMNEHLKVLRSMTPCFYIKRGDQASIIGGVVDFIKELEQVVEALESKKRRKSSIGLISPRARANPNPTRVVEVDDGDSCSSISVMKEVVVCKNSSTCGAEVEVKMSGTSNVIVKGICGRNIPSQLSNIISLLESLSFQVLHLNITTLHSHTLLYHFLLKIGVECEVSLEELANQVQQTFCSASHHASNVTTT